MKKEELEEDINFVMANLDEVLNDKKGLYDDIVDYEMLYLIRKNLKKEFNDLVKKIKPYRENNDIKMVMKYQKSINHIKRLNSKLSIYKDNYKKRLKAKKEDNVSRNHKKKVSFPKTKKVNVSPINPYEEMLHFLSIYDTEYFSELLYDLKTSKYFDEYSIALETVFPIEVEKKLSKVTRLTDEELENLSIVGRDVVLNKIRTINKDEMYAKSEIIFLKRMAKIFESLKPIIYEEPVNDTSSYYEILERLIDNDANYIYIKNLMESIPIFLEARKNDKHFVFLLLDRFIKNYKLKLVNQGLPYVEPTFYKELFNLNFNLGLKLSEQEKLDFNVSLVDFKYYIASKNYNDSEKVYSDVDSIINSMNNLEVKQEVEDNEALKLELSSLQYKMLDVINSSLRDGSNISSAFKFEKVPNFAFSVDYDYTGTVVLNIHILDTASFIKDDSLIYEEMKKRDLTLPNFEFRGIYPAMTFTYTFFKNNKISPVRVSSSIININTLYNEQDLDNYRKNTDLKTLLGAFKRLKEFKEININYYNQNGLETFANNVLSRDITKIFNDNSTPFIYKEYLENSEDLVRVNHNAVCDKLMKIPKREAHKVFEILDVVHDSYYVLDSDNGELELSSNKFLGLYLLTTIHRIWDNNYDKSKAIDELSELLVTLNGNDIYLPKTISKRNENNFKALVKDYKK